MWQKEILKQSVASVGEEWDGIICLVLTRYLFVRERVKKTKDWNPCLKVNRMTTKKKDADMDESKKQVTAMFSRMKRVLADLLTGAYIMFSSLR